MKTSKKVLILSGGHISPSFARKYLQKEKFQYIIAADRGLLTVDELELPVDYIVGDFDSLPKKTLDKYRNRQQNNIGLIIKEYNQEKDYTDTQIAIETGLELKPDEIVILGGTGSRIDHTLSNIQNLLIPLKKNIKTSIIDEHNKIYLINKSTKINRKELFGSYFSLLPLTQVVEEVSLLGFKYFLDKADIYMGNSLCISNEVIEDRAQILLKSGILIAIESKD